MSYPAPPWQTHGRAFLQPYLVDARSLWLPPGFEAITLAGRAIGVLGLVEYVAPSPLVYAELVWMPCLVRTTVTGDGGAPRRPRGYFVEKMYVDSDASLEAGRTEWALPKQKARFEIETDRAVIETEDGARLVLELGARGPAARTALAATTLQHAGRHLVRFKGSGSGQLRSGRLTVREARGLEDWNGWPGARRIPGLGAAIGAFAITMHEPRRLEPIVMDNGD